MTHNEQNIPLVTDLDGTLINIDTTALSMIQMLKYYPLNYIKSIFWITKGKYYVKKKIEKYSNINAELLPYNKLVLNYLIAEKAKGREIYLATASMQAIADKVQAHLKVFDGGAYGSKDEVNLSSYAKLNFIENLLGKNNFDYIGDSKSDIAVWENARIAYAIKPNISLEKKIKKNNNIRILSDKKYSNISLLFKQLNIIKWTLNLIIFLPIAVTSSKYNSEIFRNLILAFFSISLFDTFLDNKKELFELADYNFSNSKNILSGELNIFLLMKFMLAIALVSILLLLFISSGVSLLFIAFYFLMGEIFLHSREEKLNSTKEIFKFTFKLLIGYLIIK